MNGRRSVQKPYCLRALPPTAEKQPERARWPSLAGRGLGSWDRPLVHSDVVVGERTVEPVIPDLGHVATEAVSARVDGAGRSRRLIGNLADGRRCPE
jgi:hypothetical protein